MVVTLDLFSEQKPNVKYPTCCHLFTFQVNIVRTFGASILSLVSFRSINVYLKAIMLPGVRRSNMISWTNSLPPFVVAFPCFTTWLSLSCRNKNHYNGIVITILDSLWFCLNQYFVCVFAYLFVCGMVLNETTSHVRGKKSYIHALRPQMGKLIIM